MSEESLPAENAVEPSKEEKIEEIENDLHQEGSASPQSEPDSRPSEDGEAPPAAPVELPARHKRRNLADWMILVGTWLITFSLIFFAVYIGWRAYFAPEPTRQPEVVLVKDAESLVASPGQIVVPSYSAGASLQAVRRLAQVHTIVPNRPRQEVVKYTVVSGDSVFEIAKNFNIDPETVLWANYDLLNDSPESLSPGMELNIPPVNGVYYQWKEGDTIDTVANEFETTVDKIINWPGNNLDLTAPTIGAEQWIMVPDGKREFRSWVVPQIARGAAGVSKSVYGPGACEGSYEGAYGGGGFIWPTGSHVLSGNDFWSGHLGIDIAAGLGDPVVASDSGVVVFAGWSTGG